MLWFSFFGAMSGGMVGWLLEVAARMVRVVDESGQVDPVSVTLVALIGAGLYASGYGLASRTLDRMGAWALSQGPQPVRGPLIPPVGSPAARRQAQRAEAVAAEQRDGEAVEKGHASYSPASGQAAEDPQAT